MGTPVHDRDDDVYADCCCGDEEDCGRCACCCDSDDLIGYDDDIEVR